jgi:SAM-dependent methyltransferase
MTVNQSSDEVRWISDEQSVSYATVRDWVDSLGRHPDLATKNKDLKDVQRPWVLKTVSARVPRGARLLEIGGGDPWVADLLSKQGYDVSIVDPYDGRDNGPSDVAQFRRSYPRIRFIEGLFPTAIDPRLTGQFDAIYSISVLEHVPTSEIQCVCEGINRFLKPGGVSVHAVDHVLLGNGDAHHLSNLRQWCRGLCGDDGRLAQVIAALEGDPETYFLSAESHNMWRGSIPYDDFPMRRCVSIQVSSVKPGG